MTLQEQDFRIYYEEAGTGIPLLLQHTAGAHGVQWRHLFEVPAITDHFRLIAYDLPFHGKSIPPVGRAWWQEEYKLTAAFIRAVPIALVHALRLQNPVFMGCSVGGVLALDLAAHHPDVFDHVIAVEGALDIPGDTGDFLHRAFWHPQVSNEFKGRLMHGLTAPQAPEAYRRETIQTYMAGWPPLFLGDLHYYVDEFNVTEQASRIDTSRVGVHIMNGEYDASGTIELGEIAHRAIEGSTHTVMPSVGHFPMSEHPDVFVKHLLPILDGIRKTRQ
ncbi:alpha/beta hydrolase [Burkholderia sp. D-99]|nr:alpha/beta hydrolase [Burkholderia sp. D-99]